MPVNCCAYGCNETWVKGGGITFHSFPKDDERRKVWEVQLRRENFKASKHSKICSKHFTENCFDRNKLGGTWLKPDALPTIFNFPNHLQKSAKKRNPVKRLSTQNEDVDDKDVPGPSGILNKKRKRLHYMGDFSDEDVTSPTKAKKFLHIAQEQTSSLNKKIKKLSKKNDSLKRRISSLEEMLEELRQNSFISDTASSVLNVSISGPAAEFIKRLEDSKSRDAYPPELKAFAMTLNFYSSKAYDYVRKTFNCNLPHPSTIRNWYKGVDGTPGFTSEALSALRVKAEEVGKTVHCALIMDEMSIRKHVEWDKDKFLGYIDMGTNVDDDQLPYAKEALTFLVNCLNGNWKVPVAYFLIDGLSGAERANLVREALHCIHETGVNVVSLTFDGCSSNIAAANALGANLSPDKLTHFFPHPVTGKDVFVILDLCHMLKLVRNCLAAKGSICDGDGGLIRWQHIVDLEKHQSEEGLHAATKLCSRHIQWTREKMKVKLAAQVLSRSVADALAYLAFDLKHPSFLNSSPTIAFLRKFNDLFDILNSKNLLSKEFKAPLKLENKTAIMSFFYDVEIYIQNFKTAVNGEKILITNRKTGFLGFLICIKSIRSLYNLLSENSLEMKFILTYKLSQDHLELFFSAIRSQGGHNNNPTAKQFKAAYTRLLVHHNIMTSDSANCIVLDKTNIINVTQSTNIYLNAINASDQDDMRNTSPAQSSKEETSRSFKQLSQYVSDVVSYIAGFVSKKLKTGIKCQDCSVSLIGEAFEDKLSSRKNRGGLHSPSLNVIKMCKIGEKIFRTAQAMGKLQKNNIMHKLIANSLGEALESNTEIFEDLNKHSLEHGPLDSHKVFLMKAVLFEYFKIRLYHTGRMITHNLQEKKVRSLNLKNTIFSGQ